MNVFHNLPTIFNLLLFGAQKHHACLLSLWAPITWRPSTPSQLCTVLVMEGPGVHSSPFSLGMINCEKFMVCKGNANIQCHLLWVRSQLDMTESLPSASRPETEGVHLRLLAACQLCRCGGGHVQSWASHGHCAFTMPDLPAVADSSAGLLVSCCYQYHFLDFAYFL